MALTDHIAILTYHALAQPQQNKKKAAKPLEYFAVIAFPPTAADDLKALLLGVAPGGSLAGVDVRVPRNSQNAKPIPGVPGDWFIIRAATQFPPHLADEAGRQLDQATQVGDIRLKFYPGKRVRVALSAYPWNFQGKAGISFNLNGVMAVSDGERLNIGNQAASAFASYVDPSAGASNASANPFGNTASQAAPQQNGNPFGGSAQTGTSSGSTAGAGADPFQQSNRTAAANPFA
jgi:hypothetical protein